MGILRGTLRFFGFGAQAEIAQKTIGRTFRIDDRQRLREEAAKLLWACNVLGDWLFPGLQGKWLGNVRASGIIVAVIASILPMLLLFRLGHRLTNRVPARLQRVDAAHVQTIPSKPSNGEQDGN